MRARLPDREGVITRGGVRVAFEFFGRGEPGLLLVPASPITHARSWKGIVPALARRFTVVTTDGRGTGRSGRPHTPGCYAPTEVTADLLAVLDAADLNQAVLVAHCQLPPGRTVDLNALVSAGVRLAGIADGVAQFSGSLPNACALADLKLGRLLNTIDAWAGTAGERFAPTVVRSAPLGLDLRSGEISAIVWATGYRPDLSWLDIPVLDRRGRVIHDGGVTACPGLYLIGMPFLRRRKSSLIDGAADDAAELTRHLAGHLDAVAGRRERSAS